MNKIWIVIEYHFIFNTFISSVREIAAETEYRTILVRKFENQWKPLNGRYLSQCILETYSISWKICRKMKTCFFGIRIFLGDGYTIISELFTWKIIQKYFPFTPCDTYITSGVALLSVSECCDKCHIIIRWPH